MSEEPAKKAGIGKKLGMGCLVVVGGIIGLGVIGSMVDGGKGSGSQAGSSTPTPAVAEVADPKPSGLTFAQENAARSATQYLDMSGFSRSGLISQLSSDAGNGYAVADATAAVDSLNVDWNEQAARSAKQYLDMSGFSCKGLIQQLSSSAGSKYTVEQATYGAKQAGAC